MKNLLQSQATRQFLGIVCILTLHALLASAANQNGFFVKHQTTKNLQTEADWLNWMKKQEPKRLVKTNGHANDAKSSMLTKGQNNVIHADKQTVLDAFNPAKGTLHKYRDRDGKTLVWSNVPLPNSMIENQNGKTRVFKNPPLYIAARLDKNNVPIHFSTAYTDRPSSGNSKFAYAKNGKRYPTTNSAVAPPNVGTALGGTSRTPASQLTKSKPKWG